MEHTENNMEWTKVDYKYPNQKVIIHEATKSNYDPFSPSLRNPYRDAQYECRLSSEKDADGMIKTFYGRVGRGYPKPSRVPNLALAFVGYITVVLGIALVVRIAFLYFAMK